MPFSVDQIRAALAVHNPHFLEREPSHAEAAVALVLAGAGTDLSLCAIRRAEHPLDPWSGHMALPGGRSSPEDPSPRAVAERETLEEVGISLGDPHWIGPLSDVLVRLGGGGDRQMILSSFVYYLGEELAPFAVSDEVAEAFWIPLSHLWDPGNADHLEWERSGTRLLYPAIRFRGHSIWGLTFRVLTLFSDVLDSPLPHLEEIPRPGPVNRKEIPVKRSSLFLMLMLAVALAAPAGAAKTTVCQMSYTLSGWSAFYKVAHGQGTITCDNGQEARVTLEAKGGGLTAGKYKVTDGIGKFNEVTDISELFGTYVQAAAEAGAVKSSSASAMTKGEVSLALAGKGTGINLGISFGKFTISKK